MTRAICYQDAGVVFDQRACAATSVAHYQRLRTACTCACSDLLPRLFTRHLVAHHWHLCCASLSRISIVARNAGKNVLAVGWCFERVKNGRHRRTWKEKRRQHARCAAQSANGGAGDVWIARAALLCAHQILRTWYLLRRRAASHSACACGRWLRVRTLFLFCLFARAAR